MKPWVPSPTSPPPQKLLSWEASYWDYLLSLFLRKTDLGRIWVRYCSILLIPNGHLLFYISLLFLSSSSLLSSWFLVTSEEHVGYLFFEIGPCSVIVGCSWILYSPSRPLTQHNPPVSVSPVPGSQAWATTPNSEHAGWKYQALHRGACGSPETRLTTWTGGGAQRFLCCVIEGSFAEKEFPGGDTCG